jgi:branched-subunit amino acid transport protein
MPFVAIVVLAVGTYALRIAGPLAHHRFTLPPRLQQLLSDAAVVLLVALVVTSAVAAGRHPAGWARPVAVLVAGVLVWRRAPFPVVVIAAAATAAGLRILGVS